MTKIKLLIILNMAGWLLVFSHLNLCAEPTSPIADLYAQAKGGQTFYEPSKSEIARARKLFARMFSMENFQQDRKMPGWGKLGFRAVRLQQDSREYIAIVEDGAQKGRGFYLFANEPGSRTALMVPHGSKDLKTGKIGIEMMSRGDFVGGAFNTVPRYSKSGDQGQNQDMAHTRHSYFVSYTQAFADVFPQGRLVQLHGFAKEKRRTKSGRQADVILSSGSSILPQHIRELTACLRKTRFDIALYPLQVRELGGTTNISGNILQSMGHSGFVHLEMNYQLRKSMASSSQLLRSFKNCLELGK